MGATRIFGRFINFPEIPTPPNPATNVGRLYCKDLASITTLFFRDEAGTETNLLAAAGGGEANTASSEGSGASIVLTKSGVNLPFRSFLGELNRIIITANANDLTFTLATQVVATDKANLFGDFDQTFRDNRFRINNPADSFSYTFVAAALGLNVNLLLPLMTASDTLALLALAQTFTNKTIDADLNVLSNIGSAEVKPELISGQTNDATPDGAADSVMTFDNSTGLLKKVLLDNLPGGGGGESNTISSLGGGTSPLTATIPKSGVDLRVKSLSVTAPIAKTDSADLITLTLNALVNADIDTVAAIAITKLANGAADDVVKTNPGGTALEHGKLANANISASAAIATSKLADSANFVLINKANTFDDFAQTFRDNQLKINNPADSFAYTLVAAAIGANFNLLFPLLTGNDTIAVLNLAQALTNKTIDADLNTITNIENADIKAAAAIAYSKLNLTGLIINADIASGAAIAQSKLAAIVNANLPVGTAFQRKRTNSGATAIEDFTEEAGIPFLIDGGGAVITTGIKGVVRVPFDCEITLATLLADVSGSIVVDINRYTSLTNYNSGTKATITSTTPPTLSSAKSSEDSTLASWTVVLNQGDILEFEVDSATTVEIVTCQLRVNKRG